MMRKAGCNMRARAVLLALLAVLAGAATAQDARLTMLGTGDAARGWEAVGRLDIDGKGFCTGSLIAPDLVLTAAHCLFERDTGNRIDPARMEFLAGMRNGQALAYRGVRRAAIDAGYSHTRTPHVRQHRHDLALLELEQPIRSTQVTPFATSRSVGAGSEVGIVSYAHDRAEAPAIERVCNVLGAQDGIMVMSCVVDFGSSGAPVFRVDQGVARIVSVVSAKAEMNGAPVSIGTEVDQSLAALRATLAAGGGHIQPAPPARIRVGGSARIDTGAKFVRP